MLHLAVMPEGFNTVKFILDEYAEVDINSTTNLDKQTALHIAIDSRMSNPEIVKLLLEYRADVNFKSKFGAPLYRAIHKKPELPLIEISMKYGKDIKENNNKGVNLLLIATRLKCDYKILEILETN